MAKKESPYDGAFGLILADKVFGGKATAEIKSQSRAVVKYAGRQFLVVLSRSGGGSELRASVEILVKGEWVLRGLTGKFSDWKRLSVAVGALINGHVERAKSAVANDEAQKRHDKQREAANAIVETLQAVTRHDDRIGITTEDSWYRSDKGPGVKISVTFREKDWHYAQMIVDFLKENTGDPRPEQPATVAGEEK